MDGEPAGVLVSHVAANLYAPPGGNEHTHSPDLLVPPRQRRERAMAKAYSNDLRSMACAKRSRRSLRRCGIFPPNAPDLNPIEQAFTKLKAALRKSAARTVKTLWNHIGKLLRTFAPEECANYLRHAGYE
jgi:transposase